MPNSKNKYSASNSDGLKVFIHEHDARPSASPGINVK